MKSLKLFFAVAAIALGMCACGPEDPDEPNIDYKVFVGTWGAETIQYYNIDYWGQPIENTIETYDFIPGDTIDGIDLIFRDDQTGEMRDHSRDTLIVVASTNPITYDTIICPDTTVVTKFTYRFHKDDNILSMKMLYGTTTKIYEMHILEYSDNKFVYENEYLEDYVEKAVLIRTNTEPIDKAAKRSSKPVARPRHKGSLLSD